MTKRTAEVKRAYEFRAPSADGYRRWILRWARVLEYHNVVRWLVVIESS